MAAVTARQCRVWRAVVTSRSGVVMNSLGRAAIGEGSQIRNWPKLIFYAARCGKNEPRRLRPGNLSQEHGYLGDGGVVGAHAFRGFRLNADTRRVNTQQLGDTAAESLWRADRSSAQPESGCCPHCPPRNRLPRSACSASRTNRTESAPFHFGSVGGKNVPMSPAAIAPSSASVKACSRTSPSEWPARPLSWGIRTPPIFSGMPGLNSWESQPKPMRGMCCGLDKIPRLWSNCKRNDAESLPC